MKLNTLAERIIDKNVFCSQTSLVSKSFETEIFDLEDINNLFAKEREEDEEQEQEIFEWVLVSDWLAENLDKQGEPVLFNDYGTWWGRTTFGQMYCMDTVIENIAKISKEEINLSLYNIFLA